MNKFCPNCGKPVDKNDKVCGNCGYRLKAQAPSVKPVSTVQVKKRPKPAPKRNRWIVPLAILVGVLVVGGAGYWAYNQFYGQNNQASVAPKQQSSSTSTSQNKRVESSSSSEDTSQENSSSATEKSTSSESNKESSKYTNEEWMLMGYLAYKNKNLGGSVDSTIGSVMKEFSSGDLESVKESNDSYSLSNQYGSVDVKVNANDVVVTNDGVTRTSKEDLERMFEDDTHEVWLMTKYTNLDGD